MLHEIIHALIQRILHDKIIFGLLIIGILTIFVGKFNGNDASSLQDTSAVSMQSATANKAQTSYEATKIEPSLATDFIKWWLTLSMDYSPQTAPQSHQQAFAWMNQDAKVAFESTFWNQEIVSGIVDRRIVAAFQPNAVVAKAINPDGSVVVGVSGTCVLQNNGQPINYQVQTDFLVKRARDGLRVAGFYNELASAQSTSAP